MEEILGHLAESFFLYKIIVIYLAVEPNEPQNHLSQGIYILVLIYNLVELMLKLGLSEIEQCRVFTLLD